MLIVQNIDNEDLDLSVLRSLGSFDAAHLLPVIARLSNTYLEPDTNHSPRVVPLIFVY